MRVRSTLAIGVCLLLHVASCTDDAPPCYVGDHLICTCGGPLYGYQACLADESGWGPCVCDGSTPGLDAGTR